MLFSLNKYQSIFFIRSGLKQVKIVLNSIKFIDFLIGRSENCKKKRCGKYIPLVVMYWEWNMWKWTGVTVIFLFVSIYFVRISFICVRICRKILTRLFNFNEDLFRNVLNNLKIFPLKKREWEKYFHIFLTSFIMR